MLSLIETSILMWGPTIGSSGATGAGGQRKFAILRLRQSGRSSNLVRGLKGFTRIIGSTQIELATDEVVYFWLPDPSIEVGPPSWSPVKAALRAAGVLGSMDKFTTNFFDRGAIKATLLTVPATTRKADRETLRSWWRTVFGGSKRLCNWVINADDVKPVVIGEGIESLSNARLTREKRKISPLHLAFLLPAISRCCQFCHGAARRQALLSENHHPGLHDYCQRHQPTIVGVVWLRVGV